MPGAYDQKSIQAHFTNTNKRLAEIEEQLERLSEQAGLPYARPMADVPEEVIEIARGGDMLGAVKRYRELTGVGFDEAQELIQGL
jgi:ribosomal protein L7/L12